MKMAFHKNDYRDRQRKRPAGLPIPTHFDVQTQWRQTTVKIEFEIRIDLEGVRAEYDLDSIPAALKLTQQDATDGAKECIRDWMQRLHFHGDIIEADQ